MLTIYVETALPLDALRRQIPSALIMIYPMDGLGYYDWLASDIFRT